MHEPLIRISRFLPRHVPEFLVMAQREGWICDRWELDFLFQTFPRGSYVAMIDEHPGAFVTSVKYERSGWIGNLLVHHPHRGKGLGRMMLNLCLEGLEGAGAETIWLTASEDGRRLYESVGFVPLDSIIRWFGAGDFRTDNEQCWIDNRAMVEELDREGWGDRRDVLLHAVAARSSFLNNGDAFLMAQRTAAGLQLGPWGCREPASADLLLGEYWRSSPSSGKHIFLDTPSGNGFIQSLLDRSGFTSCGSTLLMYRGKRPDYLPGSICALASMGSMG